MKRLFWLVALVSAGLLFAPPAAFAQEEEMEMPAEEAPACKFICAPVFLFMPGFVATNIFDAPEDPVTGEEADEFFEFMLRWQVVAPTAIPRVALVAETQWTPFADGEGGDFEFNSPLFVYGLIITLFDSPYFAASLDPIFIYSPLADPDGSAEYDHKFTLELALIPKLGTMMGAPAGAFLGGVSAFFLVDYIITGLPSEDDLGGCDQCEPDHWVLLGGLIIPIAPSGF